MQHINHFLSLLMVIMVVGCDSNSSQKKNTSGTQIEKGAITFSNGWARPGSKGGNSAAYLTVHNGTNTADTLLTVTTDAAVKAALHQSFQENGMVGMRPAGSKAIKPDSSLKISPGGYHIMLMNLKKALAMGDSIGLSLKFSESGEHQITVPIKLHP